MPLSLTAIASGATIDADVLKARAASIERYVNEQIAVGDRGTNWMNSVHVFSPDFQYAGASAGRLPLSGGEVWWSRREEDKSRRFVTSWRMTEDGVAIPGLCRTIHLRQNIAATGYRLVVLASFYAFEYGGWLDTGSVLDGPTERCATFRLAINGTGIAATNRYLYRSSDDNPASPSPSPAGVAYNGTIYARKQITMMYADDGTLAAGAGLHDIEIRCAPIPMATDHWKHIFVDQGTLIVRYRDR